MAISFGYSHYRTFKLPKPEKKLPKDAAFQRDCHYLQELTSTAPHLP